MTTTYLNPTNFRVDSAAAIRNWAGQIRATFLAGGWVQTADSGQTNADALPIPSGVNTVSGFEVWRMADAFQPTAPVFVKIEYGEGGGVFVPSIWLTIGTGSDGAGNLTGVLQPRAQYHAVGNGVATAISFGSADPGRIAWCGGSAQARILFSIERSRDLAGAYTSDGLQILVDSNSSAAAVFRLNRYVRFSADTFASSTNLGAFVPSGTTWADAGNTVGVCPVRFFNGMPSNPGISWVVYLNGDTAVQVPVTLPLYGTNRTFMPLGSALVGSVASGNLVSTFMMIWE